MQYVVTFFFFFYLSSVLYNYLNGLKALSPVMLFAKQNEAESSHF